MYKNLSYLTLAVVLSITMTADGASAKSFNIGGAFSDAFKTSTTRSLGSVKKGFTDNLTKTATQTVSGFVTGGTNLLLDNVGLGGYKSTLSSVTHGATSLTQIQNNFQKQVTTSLMKPVNGLATTAKTTLTGGATSFLDGLRPGNNTTNNISSIGSFLDSESIMVSSAPGISFSPSTTDTTLSFLNTQEPSYLTSTENTFTFNDTTGNSGFAFTEDTAYNNVTSTECHTDECWYAANPEYVKPESYAYDFGDGDVSYMDLNDNDNGNGNGNGNNTDTDNTDGKIANTNSGAINSFQNNGGVSSGSGKKSEDDSKWKII